MIKKKVYQTLHDRDNPDIVNANGPFICTRKDAWLGDGYYFWDTFIELAHKWGEFGYNNKYFICEAECDFDIETCFDLTQPEHLVEFEECVEYMKDNGLIASNEFSVINTSVPRIVNFLKAQEQFSYEAIRAYAPNTISYNDEYFKKFKMRFNSKKNQYLDMRPAYQICFLNKNSLNLRSYKLIFPEIYESNFTI